MVTWFAHGCPGNQLDQVIGLGSLQHIVLMCCTAVALQGTESAEAQAARAAGGVARGGTAYVNLETGDCHGDEASVGALLATGVARVVIGLPNPLQHVRGVARTLLQANGVAVDVLGETPVATEAAAEQAALEACLAVNEVSLPVQSTSHERSCNALLP